MTGHYSVRGVVTPEGASVIIRDDENRAHYGTGFTLQDAFDAALCQLNAEIERAEDEQRRIA